MSKRILVVRHITTYRYSEPVSFGEHQMMFRPRASYDIRLLKTSLEVFPKPSSMRWRHDVFDNTVAVATFDQKAAELRFESTASLEHLEISLPDYELEAHARTYPFVYSNHDFFNLDQALKSHCPAPEVGAWALQFLSSGRTTDTMGLLLRMTLGIKAQFAYERRVEKGVQTPLETLQSGRGSCRDFALLMMEAVRTLGLAARFVSGYIFMPDFGTTIGAGSTHAWMQVFLPGAGWVDFDPTNSIVGNRNLIRVAVAWNPAEALPLWGSYIGSAASFRGMEVTVNVTEERDG